MRLGERLKIEKKNGLKVKPFFENKGWRYSVHNNEFLKDHKIAYIYEDDIIIYFDLFVATEKFNPHHVIKIKE